MSNRRPRKKPPVTFEDDDFIFADEKYIKDEKRIFGIKSEYMVFYIAAAIVGIIIVFVVALTTFNLFTGNSPIRPPSNEPIFNVPPTNADNENVPEINTSRFVGMVINVDENSRVFQIHNVTSRENSHLFVTFDSELRGRFGQIVVLSEINIGDIVNVEFNTSNNNIIQLSMQENSVWERRFITGVTVDLSSSAIIYGGNMYFFNTDTLVMNNGNRQNISDISPLTMITMRGIDNTVWNIEIERGFGTVVVTNNANILNGFVEISRESSIRVGQNISPADQIVNVSEGHHTVIIHGSNIDLNVRDIFVTNGGTHEIDTLDIEIVSGYLNIVINVENPTTTVNGVTVNVENPIDLEFGPTRVVISREGYVTFDEVVDFTEHNQFLYVNLIPYSPPTTENVNGNGNNNGNNNTNVFGNANVAPEPATRVEIRSIPSGANVLIDGSFVGVTPVITDIQRGLRNVLLQMDGFQQTTATIFVSAPPMLPFEYEMQPLPSMPQPPVGTNPATNLPVVNPPATAPPQVTPPTIIPPTDTPVLPAPPSGIPTGVIEPVIPPNENNSNTQNEISFIPALDNEDE
ncbi:MAG: PEGA domain-containing protein [Defluviitaleaceae bacterium]|nr:PEGA domain-containing protein [Defluviitaleaceae bacterium]